MQIVEVTDLGARSAVLTLQSRRTPMKIVIFPMVHLAEERFYKSVEKRLRSFDIVVAEGIKGASASTAALTRSYRFLQHKKSLGLVVQRLDYQSLDVQLVEPDLTSAEMDEQWSRIPLRQRFMIGAMVPCFVIWMLCRGSRAVIAQHLATDDLRSPRDLALQEAAEQSFRDVERLLLDARERALFDALQAIYERHCAEPVSVAVCTAPDTS